MTCHFQQAPKAATGRVDPAKRNFALLAQNGSRMDALTLAAFRLSRITAIAPARQMRMGLLCSASLLVAYALVG